MRTLTADDVPAVIDVLCDAFVDYPVMRFVLGDDDYERRLPRLVRFFVLARVLRGETLLGVGEGGALRGAALVSRPESPSPPTLAALREEVWLELGSGARARYEAFGAATAAFVVDAPHIHLNMLGVRRSDHGAGLGRRLTDRVHGISASDPTSTGVTLTTEDESNVAFYEHLGYEVLGRAEVGPGLRSWGFFRADAGTGSVSG